MQTSTLRLKRFFALASVSLSSFFAIAQSGALPGNTASTLVEIDARQQPPVPEPSDFKGGTSLAPWGSSIGLNDQYLTRNGKPWLPVMGEFHFSRYPEADWEEELLKMQAAGVQIVSSYIFWNHIEEVQGVFDWKGQRDLRHFVELCQKHHMYFYLRIGPWAHGESRYGGFPDWVVNQSKIRTSDPKFLHFVDALYRQIGAQVKGLLWKDGGPIIGVQIENEYGARGVDGGPAYILKLKKMALSGGLDTPLYTVTGWDNAVWPPGEFLPVYGGYPDAPWDPGPGAIPPGEVYLFRFHSRISGNMGFIGSNHSDGPQTDLRTPFLTAEVGGGMQNTYHRRPVVNADDVAAMVPVMIGSGANMLGYYMFQGGENPDSKLGPLNESKMTGYPSDLPVKTYDFEAPLSEFGREQNAYGNLKLFNYFLNDFGPDLAPMAVHAPVLLPSSAADNSVLRVAARSKGDTGFLFLNNHVRNLGMAEHKAVQVRLQLPSGPMMIPGTPVDVPSDTYFVWPINMDLDGLHLRYGTVQPLCRTVSGQTILYVFFAIPGVRSELSFASDSSSSIKVVGGTKHLSPEQTLVSGFEPSDHAVVEANQPDGKKVLIVVLTRTQAKSATLITLADGNHLVLSSQEVFSDGRTMTLRAFQNPDFRFAVWPSLASAHGGLGPIESLADGGLFKRYRFHGKPHHVKASWTPAPSTEPVELPRSDPATVPTDQEIESAPHWKIGLPKDAFSGVVDLFLEVSYSGDIARLSADGHLLTDNFYNGLPWNIGLKRFRSQAESGGLEIAIVPWREKSDVVLEGFAEREMVAHRSMLVSVAAIPEFQLVVQ